MWASTEYDNNSNTTTIINNHKMNKDSKGVKLTNIISPGWIPKWKLSYMYHYPQMQWFCLFIVACQQNGENINIFIRHFFSFIFHTHPCKSIKPRSYTYIGLIFVTLQERKSAQWFLDFCCFCCCLILAYQLTCCKLPASLGWCSLW